jgi:hypothetical protein
MDDEAFSRMELKLLELCDALEPRVRRLEDVRRSGSFNPSSCEVGLDDGELRGVVPMNSDRLFSMSFASVYPLYVQKAEKKGRQKNDLRTFFGEAPAINPNAGKITGTICGVRLEDIEHPLMRTIR